MVVGYRGKGCAVNIGISKTGFRCWELRINGNLTATASTIKGIERRVRIMHMMADMSDKGIKGCL